MCIHSLCNLIWLHQGRQKTARNLIVTSLIFTYMYFLINIRNIQLHYKWNPEIKIKNKFYCAIKYSVQKNRFHIILFFCSVDNNTRHNYVIIVHHPIFFSSSSSIRIKKVFVLILLWKTFFLAIQVKLKYNNDR